MKLNYDRKSKDPTYIIQKRYRNGKNTTTKNTARIGKHSELLKITDVSLAYAKEQVDRYNEKEKKNNKVSMEVTIDFNEKIKTSEHLNYYCEEPEFDYVQILRTMDIMQEHYEDYISHLYEKSCSIVKRNTAVCYYDCTNYYFEIESPDDDSVDEINR